MPKRVFSLLMSVLMAVTTMQMAAAPAAASMPGASTTPYPIPIGPSGLPVLERGDDTVNDVLSDDILPGHRYLDTGDAAMQDLIGKLDRLLGTTTENGAAGTSDIAPFLALLEGAMNGDTKLFTDALGLNLDSQQDMQKLMEAFLSKYVYQDKVINAMVGILYPAVLDQFEGLWGSALADRCSSAVMQPAFYTLYECLTAQKGSRSEVSWQIGLRLYPNMLGRIVDGNLFGEAKRMLASGNRNNGAEIPGLRAADFADPAIYPTVYKNGWNSGNQTNNNRFNTDDSASGAKVSDRDTMRLLYFDDPFITDPNTQVQANIAKPGAWSFDATRGNPQFYRLYPDQRDDVPILDENGVQVIDDEGNPVFNAHKNNPLNIPWNINGDKFLFMNALKTVLHGIWPVIGGLLLNTQQKKVNDQVAQAGVVVGTANVDMSLYFHAMPAYAVVLNPIFEVLLGGSAPGSPAKTYTLTPKQLEDIGAKKPMTTAGMNWGMPNSANQWNAHVTPAAGYNGTNANVLFNPQNAAQSDGPMDLVNALFFSLDAIVGELSKAPATKILEILPNVVYALKENRLSPLMESLTLIIQARLWTAGLVVCGQGCGGGQQENLVVPVNIMEMLASGGGEGLDIGALLSDLTLDNIMDSIELEQEDGTKAPLRDKVDEIGLYPLLDRLPQHGPVNMAAPSNRFVNGINATTPSGSGFLVFTTRTGYTINGKAQGTDWTGSGGVTGGGDLAQGLNDNPSDPDHNHYDVFLNNYDVNRRWIEVRKPDVLKDILHWSLDGDLIPFTLNTNSSWEAAAAIAEMVRPNPANDLPAISLDAPLTIDPNDVYPSWWGETGQTGIRDDDPSYGTGGEDEAKIDAEYLLANANAILNVLYQVLFSQTGTIQEKIDELLRDMAGVDGETLISTHTLKFLDSKVKALVAALEEKSTDPDEQKPGDIIELLAALLDRIVMIGGNAIDLNDVLAQLKAFDANDPAYASIDTVEDLARAVSDLAAPLGFVFDFLLGGKDLGLLEIRPGQGEGLITVKGGSGWDELSSLLNALGMSLGIADVMGTTPYAGLADSEKVYTPVKAIVDIAYTVIDDPVLGLLNVLPTLLYHIAPQADGSPIEQRINRFAHPVYVLLDTLRPLVDVLAMAEVDLSGIVSGLNDTLPIGISFGSGGLKLDVIAGLEELLADALDTLNMTAEELVASFLIGTWDGTNSYIETEAPAVLFRLINVVLAQFGVNGIDAIYDNYYEFITRLIQYGKIPAYGPIDYTEAPDGSLVTAPVTTTYYPSNYFSGTDISWFKKDWAKYLTDNIDLVVNFLWTQLVYSDNLTIGEGGTGLKELVNGLFAKLDEMLSQPLNLEVKETLWGTVEALFGNELYVQDNLTKLVDLALEGKEWVDTFELPIPDSLQGTEILGMELTVPTIKELVKTFIAVGDTPLDLDVVFQPFVDYRANPAAFAVTDKASFIDVLARMLQPAFPVLHFLLSGENVKIIYNEDMDLTHNDEYNNGTGDNDGPVNDNWTPDAPGAQKDKGLLTVFGYEGYEYGLMPLLLALGTDIPGYQDIVRTADEFEAGAIRAGGPGTPVTDAADQVKAIVEPLLFIVESLMKNPAQTLMQLLPNAAYILMDNGTGGAQETSILQQAIDRLLQPVTSLIRFLPQQYYDQIDDLLAPVGGLAAFEKGMLGFGRLAQEKAEELLASAGFDLLFEDLLVGTKTVYPKAGHASAGIGGTADYVKVDVDDLLVVLLEKAGLFEMVGDNKTLQRLIQILGEGGISFGGASSKIDYGAAPDAITALNQPQWLLDTNAPQYLLKNADLVVDFLWREVLADDSIGLKESLEDLLAYYVPELELEVKPSLAETVWQVFGKDAFVTKNFVALVDTVKQAIEDLNVDLSQIDAFDLGALGIELVEGEKVNLAEILNRIVTIDGKQIDFQAIIDAFMTFDGSTLEINSKETFMDAAVQVFGPLMPLLNILLAGSNVRIIEAAGITEGAPGIGKEGVFLNIEGADGYLNLLPILIGLGAGLGDEYLDQLMGLNAFKAADASDEAQLRAIIEPILYVFDQLLTAPAHTALSILPNLVYLISEAGPGKSILQQAADNLFVTLEKALELADLDLMTIYPDITNLNFDAKLSGALGFDINLLVIAGKAQVREALREAGINSLNDTTTPYTDYITATPLDTMIQLIDVLYGVDKLEDFETLLKILGNGGINLGALEKIDYTQTTNPVAVTYPKWFKKSHAQYLADNADAAINWLWENLIYGEPGVKAKMEDLLHNSVGLDASIGLQPSIAETVEQIFGTDLYVQDNFNLIVGMIQDAIDSLAIDFDDLKEYDLAELGLDGLTGTVNLLEIVGKVVMIDGKSLNDLNIDISAIIDDFMAIAPGGIVIDDRASFLTALQDVLAPLMPIVNILLAGSRIDIAHLGTETYPMEGVNPHAFLSIVGMDAYSTAILPVLIGIGGGVPGFLNALTVPEAFKALPGEDQIMALIDPVLFLLDQLLASPVQTLLQVLPNAAFLISNGENGTDSILRQAAGIILEPIRAALELLNMSAVLDGLGIDLDALNLEDTVNGFLADIDPLLTVKSLIIGEKKRPGGALDQLGKDDIVYYIQPDIADLLTSLLDMFVFDLLEENNLTGLVKFLGGERPDWPKYITYPKVNTGVKYNFIWAKGDAKKLAKNAETYLNVLFELIYGKPFGSLPNADSGSEAADSFLKDILGNAVFTQENFDKLLNLIQSKIPQLDDTDILDTGLTLRELIKKVASYGGAPLDALGILEHLRTWAPAGPITDQESFLNGLADYLEGAMPLLDFVLNSKDIAVLDNVEGVNNKNGLIRVPGYEGYKYGIVPIFEALLMPLGMESAIMETAAFAAASDHAKARALVEPLAKCVETITTNSIGAVLKLIPNLAYNIRGKNGVSPLNQAIARVLLPVNNVLDAAGMAPVAVDVSDLLGGVFELEVSGRKLSAFGLEITLLDDLMLGALTVYTSAKNGDPDAKYIKGDTALSADVVTVILRIVVKILQNSLNRNELILLLAELTGLKGFSVTLLKWHFGLMLWFTKWLPFGKDLALRSVLRWARILKFFAPAIHWFLKAFGIR